MINDVVSEISLIDGTSLRGGAQPAVFDRLRSEFQISLPPDHEQFLRTSNGAEVYCGYFRLFGVYSSKTIDAMRWNEDEWWKFAWDGRCDDYWCFGETAWGDQYAYAYSKASGVIGGTVYFLDALSMTSQVIAESFEEFIEKEFMRCAQQPYDEMVIAARRVIGQLEPLYHVVYLPSPLLGGEENISNVRKLDARAAMICNGDIAVGLDAGPPQGRVIGVDSYEDDMLRLRCRLKWDLAEA